MKSVLIRSALSLVALWVWRLSSVMFNTNAALVTSSSAVGQLSNSDQAAMSNAVTNQLFSSGLPLIILFAVFLAIWWKPLTKLVTSKDEVKSLLMVFALVTGASFYAPHANAYYDQTNRSEFVEIGPNQSAFLIPMIGANKDSQKQFGSIEYLNTNKVAAKRIQIPHVLADNTSLLRDYYVPSAKLFILDRTPFMREWASSATKGTSASNQGFRFESSESITIETAITVSAYVKEEDAATFFYWFGSKNLASTKPEDTFASVAYGKSLADVMDTVVRGRVQAALAREFGSRSLRVGIASKAEIIDSVEKIVKAEFSAKGITIQYIGFADELTLPTAIQSVINSVFIANLKYDNRVAYDSVLNLDQRQAEIDVIKAKGETMKKWDGKLNFPSFMVASEGFLNAIMNFFKGGK